jgi:tetratricopeptide (TPR) repeat protein
LALHESSGLRHSAAEIWDSLGYIHHHLEQHSEAIRCYERAIGFDREFGDRYNTATTRREPDQARRRPRDGGDRDAARRAWVSWNWRVLS